MQRSGSSRIGCRIHVGNPPADYPHHFTKKAHPCYNGRGIKPSLVWGIMN